MDRTIDLDGCVNFRDLGGYPTRDGWQLRWRLFYRADALQNLSERDMARIAGDELGVSDIVDLRSTRELETDGRAPIDGRPIEFHHLPLFDGKADRGMSAGSSLAERYLGLLERAMDPLAKVVRVMAQARGGVIYHCAAGKDRTGIVSSILLSVIGVDEDLIVADYALSQANIDAILDRLARSPSYAGVLHDFPEDTLHARPETMAGLLAGVRERWGGMAGYLEAAGVEAATLEQLTRRSLERA